MAKIRKKINTLPSLHKFVYNKGKKDWNSIDENLMKLILNVLANIVHSNLIVKPKLWHKLALYKCDIRKLVDTSHYIQSKHTFLNNKNKNQKGNIFPIFAALLPLLIAAGPLIAKAGLAVGASAAGAAIAKKIHDG